MKGDRGVVERLLLLFALALPLSISAAELILAVALVVWMAVRIRRGWRDIRWGPYAMPAAAFVLIAGATVFWSVRPEVTLHRLHRLAFPLLIVMMDSVWGGPSQPTFPRGRLIEPVLGFIAGCWILAVTDLVRVPREVAAGVDIILTGNMRDPQMYLTAICLLAAVTLPAIRKAWRPFYLPAFLFIGIAIVLHFKRGVWMGLLLALGALGCRTGRWRTLLLVGLAAAAAFSIPEVRQRIGGTLYLGQESVGGRAVLWKYAAPALLKAYPQGMGWSAVQREDLAAHTPFLQEKLNHLHNNLLQVAVETGWLGLAAWMAWMATALVVMWRAGRGPSDEVAAGIGLGVWAAFVGLMINGLFEYNFGDTEVLMLMCWLMGLSSALSAGPPRHRAQRSGK